MAPTLHNRVCVGALCEPVHVWGCVFNLCVCVVHAGWLLFGAFLFFFFHSVRVCYGGQHRCFIVFVFLRNALVRGGG